MALSDTPKSQPDAVAMAAIGLTGMVTTSSAILIGLFAYVGQVGELDRYQRALVGQAGGTAALALWLALACSLVSYINTGMVTLGKPVAWLWIVAVSLYGTCLCLLAASLWFGAWLLMA